MRVFPTKSPRQIMRLIPLNLMSCSTDSKAGILPCISEITAIFPYKFLRYLLNSLD